MGSGSSKEKAQPKKQTKPPVAKKVPLIVKQKQGDNKTVNETNNGKTLNISQISKTSNKTVVTTSARIKRETEAPQNGQSWGHSKQKTAQQTQGLGKFGSDSDSNSEGEDISAVLAATRTENERRIQEQNRINQQHQVDEYPETYAQRLQREQYGQQKLLRQKTIYRNPDEWDIDDNKIDNFDVKRFKAVNAVKPQTRDIFQSPIQTDFYGNTTAAEPDNFYPKHQSRNSRSVPSYDTSEEALLDEIEQEYNI